LPIRTHPLMVLDAFKAPTSEAEAEVRLVSPTDDLARFGAVAGLAFQSPGTAVGQVGKDELERAAQRRSQASLNFERQRLEQGLTVSAVALVDGTPVAMGSHQPVDSVCEIVGVGTLPAYRRRGLAGALTALLVKDALQRGLTTIFLSAGDSDVERVYERLGFRRIATACIAEAEGSGAVE
jgi:ribosomal protein S18 acetylase RimI-like enzyme